MNKVETTLTIEEELENLRENLNNDVVKIIKHMNKKEYEKLLVTSKKLDDIIVNYIKISKC